MAPAPFHCDECQMGFEDEMDLKNHSLAACVLYGIIHPGTLDGIGNTAAGNIRTSTEMDPAASEFEVNAISFNMTRTEDCLSDPKHAIPQVFSSIGDTDIRDDTHDSDDAVENEVSSTVIAKMSQFLYQHFKSGMREESRAALSHYVPIDVEANEAFQGGLSQYDETLGKLYTILLRLIARHAKKNNDSSDLVASPEQSTTSRLHEPIISREKQSRNKLGNVSQLEANSIGSPILQSLLRRESVNKQSTRPSTDVSSPAGRLSKMNLISANDSTRDRNENDRLRKPTTSEQVVLDVDDVAQKNQVACRIKNIWINISSGSTHYETSAGYHSNRGRSFTLSDYVSFLSQIKADDLGCTAHISYVPYYWDDRENARKRLEKFSREIHSVAHLWANGRVIVGLEKYPEYENEILPVSELCDELFSQERSILACNQLEIINLADNWPFSVVTNAAHHCNQIYLMEKRRYPRMPYRLLDAFYDMKLPQHTEVSLNLGYKALTDEFVDELKKRFQRSTEQNFKLTLLSPRNSELPNMRLQYEHGMTLTTTAQASPKKDRNCVMIVIE